MSTAVQLMGLDFGTTTSSAVVAVAEVARHATGRVELGPIRETFRSEIVFTPFTADGLDVGRVREYLDGWLTAGQVRPEMLFGGGALLTGLTARQENAPALVRLVRDRLGAALIATADDPRLEAWLAFMAGAAAISRAHPQRPVVNLDIGGGTTNLALGQNGEVRATGCWYVGARHIQVIPGGYRIENLSPFARRLFHHLGIGREVGDCLTEREVAAVVDVPVRVLESVLGGDADPSLAAILRLLEQAPFRMPGEARDPIVTLSGGVGELVYAYLHGRPWPPTTHFGDLGIDLARRLAASPRFAGPCQQFVPACAGRATVYGLLRHSTQVSGSTLFLPRPEILPLRDLPILGRVSPASSAAEVRQVLDLVRRSPAGGCVRASLAGHPDGARALGQAMARALRELDFPSGHPVVVFLPENLGKALGQYATVWGTAPVNLVVVDEIAVPEAQFAQIGRPRGPVVPVSFYGMN